MCLRFCHSDHGDRIKTVTIRQRYLRTDAWNGSRRLRVEFQQEVSETRSVDGHVRAHDVLGLFGRLGGLLLGLVLLS